MQIRICIAASYCACRMSSTSKEFNIGYGTYANILTHGTFAYTKVLFAGLGEGGGGKEGEEGGGGGGGGGRRRRRELTGNGLPSAACKRWFNVIPSSACKRWLMRRDLCPKHMFFHFLKKMGTRQWEKRQSCVSVYAQTGKFWSV